MLFWKPTEEATLLFFVFLIYVLENWICDICFKSVIFKNRALYVQLAAM